MRSAAWNEQTTLKLQVRETFTCTILRESVAELFFSSRGRMQPLGLLGLVFDNDLV